MDGLGEGTIGGAVLPSAHCWGGRSCHGRVKILRLFNSEV